MQLNMSSARWSGGFPGTVLILTKTNSQRTEWHLGRAWDGWPEVNNPRLCPVTPDTRGLQQQSPTAPLGVDPNSATGAQR